MAKKKQKQAEAQLPSAINYKNQALLSFVAPEYVDHNRGVAWYVLMISFLVLILGYAFFTSSWTTGLVFILFAGVYFMNMQRSPKNIENAITELGFKHGEQLIPYAQIKGFWIVYKPEKVNTLHLKLVKNGAELLIELGEESPSTIRNLLSREIPEIEGKGESFVNFLTRIFKL